jgi:hypothetical protein
MYDKRRNVKITYIHKSINILRLIKCIRSQVINLTHLQTSQQRYKANNSIWLEIVTDKIIQPYFLTLLSLSLTMGAKLKQFCDDKH